ncbi:protein BCAP-like [Protopterus annectens]|uniref:protein BCAP-like n=1 Tax=Protopterus annectens TaxID=7888 RepID=UPI001CFA1660|nr:protein BCAP-like [Protopterus annectens]
MPQVARQLSKKNKIMIHTGENHHIHSLLTLSDKTEVVNLAADIQNKIKVQKEKNINKRKEMDALNAQLFDQESKTEDQQNLVYRLKSQISELRLTEIHLSVQVENETRKNKQLYNEQSHLEEEMKKLVERFERESELVNAKIHKVEEEAQNNEALKLKLVDENAVLNEKLISVQEKEDITLLRKEEVMKDLQISKSHLESKLEHMSKLRTEIREMKEKIETLKETSQVNADMYSKQLEDYTKRFQQEHEESHSLQSKKDEIGKSLEDWKQVEAIYMNAKNSKIEANRRKCNELTDEAISLQNDTNYLEEQVSILTQQVDNVNNEYVIVETTLVTEINQLETEIADIMRKLQQDEEQLQATRPVMDNAEIGYDKEKATYEEVKKQTAELKRKKMYLEASIKDIKQNKQKLSKPKVRTLKF